MAAIEALASWGGVGGFRLSRRCLPTLVGMGREAHWGALSKPGAALADRTESSRCAGGPAFRAACLPGLFRVEATGRTSLCQRWADGRRGAV